MATLTVNEEPLPTLSDRKNQHQLNKTLLDNTQDLFTVAHDNEQKPKAYHVARHTWRVQKSSQTDVCHCSESQEFETTETYLNFHENSIQCIAGLHWYHNPQSHPYHHLISLFDRQFLLMCLVRDFWVACMFETFLCRFTALYFPLCCGCGLFSVFCHWAWFWSEP